MSGRKRKSAPPKRADESKRQLLSWNMFDQEEGDLHLVSDTDAILQREQSAAQRLREQERNKSAPAVLPSGRTHYTTYQEDEQLQILIGESDYYVTIQEKLNVKDGDWYCLLGTIKLNLTSTNSPSWLLDQELPNVPEFWLYVNSETNCHLVYFEIDENNENIAERSAVKLVLYFYATTDMPVACLEGLQLKAFPLVMSGYDRDCGVLELSVYMTEAGLSILKFSSDMGSRSKKFTTALQNLVRFFYGIKVPEYPEKPLSRKQDIEVLYAIVKDQHAAKPVSIKVNVQHGSLKPRLREYQKQGVQWMLTRERYQQERQQKTDSLHCLYEAITTWDGQVLYYNKYGGIMVRDMPVFVDSPPGGLLADEMGLGKTVEVLACMLSNPRGDLLPLITLPPVLLKPKEEIKVSKMLTEEEVGPGCSGVELTMPKGKRRSRSKGNEKRSKSKEDEMVNDEDRETKKTQKRSRKKKKVPTATLR